jgi:hypothetical protein
MARTGSGQGLQGPGRPVCPSAAIFAFPCQAYAEWIGLTLSMLTERDRLGESEDHHVASLAEMLLVMTAIPELEG